MRQGLFELRRKSVCVKRGMRMQKNFCCKMWGFEGFGRGFAFVVPCFAADVVELCL